MFIGIKYMRYVKSCQRRFTCKDFIGDNHVSSESGSIKSGATWAISVSSLTAAFVSCVLPNRTPPVRIRICFLTCFSVLGAPCN